MKQLQLCIDIFKEFHKAMPDIISKMRKTKHFHSTTMSDYHLEDDVWSHTCLCFNHFINTNKRVYYEQDFLIAIIVSIICHDIGKIYTRKIDVNRVKATFHSHGYASIQDTINFLYHLNGNGYITDLQNVMNLVLPAVSNHINHYNNTKNKELYFNNNEELREVSKLLSICDCAGSISNDTNKDVTMPKIRKNIEYNPTLKTIYLYCGVPGSGKDYIANGTQLPIFSFDNERIYHYLKNNDINNDSKSEVYKKAFIYCNENKIDLYKSMKNSIDKIEGDVIICNTNCNKKARNRIVSSLGKANYICNYVVAPLDIIYKRDENRYSKNLGPFIINRYSKNLGPFIIDKFAYNQQIPTTKENFINVNIIIN